MDEKLRAFRKRAREENRGSEKRRRYSRELREEAVAYVARRKRAGASVERIASELGVSSVSLSRWSRARENSVSLVPVEIVANDERSCLSLLTPRGYRVEGLSEASAVRLVERLG
jgi:transposase-like protein